MAYFTAAGISNEEIFSFMTEFASWPDPLTVIGGTVNSITLPVLLLLSQIAVKTNIMLKEGYFFDVGVVYADFCT